MNPEDIVWIAFHRDALSALGTRTEEGLKLTFTLRNERPAGDGNVTAELDVVATDDGKRIVDKSAVRLFIPGRD